MGLLSGTYYDGSFAGIGFMELYEGLTAVEPDTAGDVSYTKIPGGNTTVIQTSGLALQQFDLAIGVDAADLAALRGKVLSSGSLVYHAGTRTARLIKLKNPRYVHNSGSYAAVLELALT
jgi:hypothetical protein